MRYQYSAKNVAVDTRKASATLAFPLGTLDPARREENAKRIRGVGPARINGLAPAPGCFRPAEKDGGGAGSESEELAVEAPPRKTGRRKDGAESKHKSKHQSKRN